MRRKKYFDKSQRHTKIKKWKKKIFLQKSTRPKITKNKKVNKKIFLQKSTSPKNKKVEEENIFTKVAKTQK
jgi:hypothetical protein